MIIIDLLQNNILITGHVGCVIAHLPLSTPRASPPSEYKVVPNARGKNTIEEDSSNPTYNAIKTGYIDLLSSLPRYISGRRTITSSIERPISPWSRYSSTATGSPPSRSGMNRCGSVSPMKFLTRVSDAPSPSCTIVSPRTIVIISGELANMSSFR